MRVIRTAISFHELLQKNTFRFVFEFFLGGQFGRSRKSVPAKAESATLIIALLVFRRHGRAQRGPALRRHPDANS